MENRPRYYAFILRVWLAGDSGGPQWRASLEDTHTGERKGFSTLQGLYEYLVQQTRRNAEHKRAARDDACKD